MCLDLEVVIPYVPFCRIQQDNHLSESQKILNCPPCKRLHGCQKIHLFVAYVTFTRKLVAIVCFPGCLPSNDHYCRDGNFGGAPLSNRPKISQCWCHTTKMKSCLTHEISWNPSLIVNHNFMGNLKWRWYTCHVKSGIQIPHLNSCSAHEVPWAIRAWSSTGKKGSGIIRYVSLYIPSGKLT